MATDNRERAVLAVALLLPTVVTLAYFKLAAAAPEWVQQAVYGAGKTVQFTLPVLWMWGALRLRKRFSWGDSTSLVLGGLFGAAVLTATLFGYHLLAGWDTFQQALTPIQSKVTDLGIAARDRFLAVAAFYALAHSFLEEYYWRWFVFGRLRVHLSEASAVWVSSAGFALHHVILLTTYFPHSPLWAALLSLSVFLGGVFWAWLYRRSGSLAGPWLGHLLVDAGLFAVGYQMIFGD